MTVYNVRCDFCLAPLHRVVPWTHVFPSGPLRVEIPRLDGTSFWWEEDTDGMWCCCEACQRLIEARNVAALVERSSAMDPSGSVPVVREWKRLVFVAFLDHPERFSFRGTPWSGPLDGQRRGARNP